MRKKRIQGALAVVESNSARAALIAESRAAGRMLGVPCTPLAIW